MNKAVFLDRDGTINVEKHYLYKIEDFEFLPGVFEGLRLLKCAGYLLVIITNQSGIARGYYTEEDFQILNDWMTDELSRQGIKVESVYFCPHFPEAAIEKYKVICNCRKPACGLYERAASNLDIDIRISWAVGDRIRDCSICEKTECRGYLIGNNEKPQIIDQVKCGKFRNIKYASNLYEAAKKIVEDER